MAVVVVLVGASLIAAEWTAASDYCGSCHEMDPYYESWQGSAHDSVPCVKCHIPPGFVSYAEVKLFSLREVYVHYTEQVRPPVAVTRDIGNDTCTRDACHDPGPVTLASSSFSHDSHAASACVDCHARLVHRSLGSPPYEDPGTMDACFACHDQPGVQEECTYCHSAPHEDLGTCTDCHTLESWGLEGFEHPTPLAGGHADLECAECHTGAASSGTGSYGTGEAPTECVDCHGDEHGGATDCSQCHSISGWTPADFEHPVALTGAHADLSCEECHTGTGSTQTFGGVEIGVAPERCVDCHGDQHGGLADCGECHTTDAWQPASFTHPGVGEHIPGGEHRLACADCHPNGYGSASCTPCHSGVPRGD